jgi:outer membrane immunogenic protein
MNRFVMALCVVAASSISVHAADLPTKAPNYIAPAPAWSWTGFYAGLNGGYGWATGDLNGVVGGGQIGYNWQTGSIVFGLEGDIQATGQKRSQTIGAFVVDEKLPWFGTVRGRLGYASGPWLLYGTAGVGWINYKLSVSSAGTTVSDNTTKAAFAVGGGVEWMFMPSWSAKLEYLYMDTGNTNVTLFGTTFTGRAKDNVVRVGVNYHF